MARSAAEASACGVCGAAAVGAWPWPAWLVPNPLSSLVAPSALSSDAGAAASLAEVAASPRPFDDDPEPAAVLISIEPAVGSNDAEAETPVVFPGYILPDDHREVPAHEGS